MRHSDIQKHISYESGINNINILCASSYKSFYIHYSLKGNFLKRILTYLYCIEINRCKSDVQKHVSYTGSHKKTFDIIWAMLGND